MSKDTFLTAARFCRRRSITHAQLVREERRGDVFAVTIDNRCFYPAVLADKAHNRHRRAKLCRRLGPFVSAMSKYDLLTSPKFSLEGETALQALRRGRRYEWALILADGLAEELLPPELRPHDYDEEA